jgi:hypothetical protein
LRSRFRLHSVDPVSQAISSPNADFPVRLAASIRAVFLRATARCFG